MKIFCFIIIIINCKPKNQARKGGGNVILNYGRLIYLMNLLSHLLEVGTF